MLEAAALYALEVGGDATSHFDMVQRVRVTPLHSCLTCSRVFDTCIGTMYYLSLLVELSSFMQQPKRLSMKKSTARRSCSLQHVSFESAEILHLGGKSIFVLQHVWSQRFVAADDESIEAGKLMR